MRKYIFSLLLLLFALPLFAQTNIGYNSGSTPDGGGNTGDEYIFASPLYTMASSGTFTSVSLYASDESGTGTRQAQIRVYDSSGNTLATSAVGSGWSNGGSWVQMSISFSRTVGQQIRYAVMSVGAPLYIGIDNSTTGQGYINYGPTAFNTWPSDPVSFDQDNDWQLGAYGTYTASGGTGMILKRRKH